MSPFGFAELEGRIPMDPATIPHETAGGRYATQTAEEMAEARAASEASTWFGVYKREISPEGFIGMVGLRPATDAPSLAAPILEVGTMIIPEDERRKKSGTLATLGAMAHAQAHDDAHVFRALASENQPGLGALITLGYVHFATEPSEKYADGSPEQEWRWADPSGIELGAAGGSDAIAGQLRAGWSKYNDYLAETTITPLPSPAPDVQ